MGEVEGGAVEGLEVGLLPGLDVVGEGEGVVGVDADVVAEVGWRATGVAVKPRLFHFQAADRRPSRERVEQGQHRRVC